MMFGSRRKLNTHVSLNGQNGSRLRSNGGKVILFLRAMEQSNKKESLRSATMKG